MNKETYNRAVAISNRLSQLQKVRIDSSGENSVVMCAGHNSCAKAKKGSWITLSEWRRDEAINRWIPVCVKTERIDGVRIKEDTFYQLVDGEFKEIE